MKPPRTFVLTVNRHIARFDKTAAHLTESGLVWEPFYCMDNQICRLTPMDTFDVDRAGERIAPKHICAQMSHYMLWKVMTYLPEDMFWALEYDVVLVPDWRAKFDSAMSVLPDDWDMVFLGSCCCEYRENKPIAKNLFEVKYPLCGHAIMYRKKALHVLLEVHQKFYAPLDIALLNDSLPKLRVYTILPAMINQRDTPMQR